MPTAVTSIPSGRIFSSSSRPTFKSVKNSLSERQVQEKLLLGGGRERRSNKSRRHMGEPQKKTQVQDER